MFPQEQLNNDIKKIEHILSKYAQNDDGTIRQTVEYIHEHLNKTQRINHKKYHQGSPSSPHYTNEEYTCAMTYVTQRLTTFVFLLSLYTDAANIPEIDTHREDIPDLLRYKIIRRVTCEGNPYRLTALGSAIASKRYMETIHVARPS